MPYVGEIRIFAGNFPPNGWMFCQGQSLPISENEVLFQLIGTTYGGDGEETFMLPNLASRLPIHMGTDSATGTTFQIGEMAGVESVTLTTQQIPQHTHQMLGTLNPAASTSPSAVSTVAIEPLSTITPYGTDAPQTTLAPQTITPDGGSQPHENMQPFLCLNFIISLFGVFPSQT
jgi:microcystin-dependent protein